MVPLPTPAAQGGAKGDSPPLPSFAPVPRRYRHDGWTPERQKAFIEALADTGCVSRAASMVNMAQTNCYTLRRSPGAEKFRRAWDAALDFGLKRLKDIAFERAIEGQLVPVFVAGKLLGFRRKRNDALLMFCLRHYGQDSNGKRTTINYFSTRASAGVDASEGPPPPGSAWSPSPSRGGIAEASTTTVRTVISGPTGGSGRSTTSTGSGQAGSGLSGAADVLEGFDGVALDAEAEAAIGAALEACAARARAADAAYEQGGDAAADAGEDDPGESYVHVGDTGHPFRGELLPSASVEDFVPFAAGEAPWEQAGADMPDWAPFDDAQDERPFETPSAPQDERPFETPSAPQDEREKD